MKLIAGLGNPGDNYFNTRHNIGFAAIDKLCYLYNIKLNLKHKALMNLCEISGQKIIFAKPQTYMNASGDSVVPIVDFYKVDVKNLIVAHDDMDLPVGKIRLRPGGSGGGHRGIASIIQNFGGLKNFPRVRIGIGRPPENWSVNSHVLSKFNDEDAKKISAALDELVPAVLCIFREGIDNAMNKFNPKKGVGSME